MRAVSSQEILQVGAVKGLKKPWFTARKMHVQLGRGVRLSADVTCWLWCVAAQQELRLVVVG